MDEIITQIAHVFIHYYSNKPAPTSKLFISEPTKAQEEKLGRLLGIFEIETPSRENSPIINEIINSLEESYYSQVENEECTCEKSFEIALEETNQKFNQLIADKKIRLVGNLNEKTIKEKVNFAITVVKGNKIILSYLNDMNLYLIHKTKQDYKLIEIKDITTEEDNNQENETKLFSNVTAGEINPGDYLFIANKSFVDYISDERIKKIVTSLPVNKAAEYFKNSLLQFEGHNFAAIILKSLIKEQEKEKALESVTSITELNTTESSTERLLSPSIWTNIKSFSVSVKSIFKSNNQGFDEENINGDINKKESKIVNEQKHDTADGDDIKKNIFLAGNISKKASTILQNIARKSKKIFKKTYPQKWLSSQKILSMKNTIRLKIAYLGNYIKKIPNLSKILLVIAILLIILLIYSASYFKHQQNTEINSEEYNNNVSTIEASINDSEASIIFGDEDKARDQITIAQNLLNALPLESQKQRETHNQLNTRVEVVIAKLRHITNIVNPTMLANLSTLQENNINITNIVFQNNNIYAFDNINNYNYQINLDSREVTKNQSNLDDIGKIQKSKIILDDILIYHDKNNFLRLTNNQYSPVPTSLNQNSKIIDFATYNNRLYNVDIGNNQIYRHPKLDNDYGAGTPWLKQEFNLSGVVSIGIDTNIWLLNKSNNQILKFNKGQQVDFEITNLEPGLDQPTQLFTNDETNYLYILEPKNKRIIVLDKEGSLNTQYFNQNFKNLKGMEIVEKEKKMFLINDNKVFFTNLSHL